MLHEYQTIGDVARELGVRPRDISDALYQQRLDAERCPTFAGRRMIPRDYVETIARVLRVEQPAGDTAE